MSTPQLHLPPIVSLADRRTNPRQMQEIRGWLSGETFDRSAAGMHVQIVDTSTGGVGFASSRRYRIGGVHWMVINHPLLTISQRVRIVSCRKEHGVFQCGAAYF